MGAGWAMGLGECCCDVDCILLEGFTGLDEWDAVRGDWSVNGSGFSETSSSDALLIWKGSYQPSVGVGVMMTAKSGTLIVVDYLDEDNYHYVTFEAVTLAQFRFDTYIGNRAKIYKRTAGVDTLLYDFYLGVPGTGWPIVSSGNTSVFFGGGFITVGQGLFPATGLGHLSYPVDPHGGTKVGYGTMSTTTGTNSFASMTIRHLGDGEGCLVMSKGCESCLYTSDSWDMMVTLKMSSLCSGGALTETNFIMPFTGTTFYSYGGVFTGQMCTWTLTTDLPCGWAWMQLVKGETDFSAENEYMLAIAHFNGTTSANYTILLFTGASSTPEDCSGGPWPIKTSGGVAIRYFPGFGFATDGGLFDAAVCKVSRL